MHKPPVTPQAEHHVKAAGMSSVMQLRELFPYHSSEQLHAALNECNGSVEAAAETLLQQTPAGPQHGAVLLDRVVSTPRHNSRSAPAARSAESSPAKPSWSALRKSQTPIAPASTGSAPPSPLYVRPRGRFAPSPPPLTDVVFPALTDSHPPAAAAEPAGEEDPDEIASSSRYSRAAQSTGVACFNQKQDAAVTVSHHRQQQLQQSVHRRSASAHSFAETAKQLPLHLMQQQHHLSPCPRAFATTASVPKHRHQQHSKQTIVSLQQQQQRRQPQQQEQQQQQRRRQPQQQEQQQQTDDLDGIVQQLPELLPWCVTAVPQEMLNSADGDAAAATAALLKVSPPSAPPVHHQQQHAEPRQLQQHSEQLAHQQQLQSAEAADVYHAMRLEAIRLTNKWQKVLKRSAAAAAAGNHSAAKLLSAEARALKAAADEAHAAAAVKIEVANNIHSSAGLWELDLHGLHVKEALIALQERLELLQALVQDILGHARAAAASPADTAAAEQELSISSTFRTATCHTIKSPVQAAPAARGGRQQLLAQLLLADDERSVPLHVRQAAARQELRVIVGKGNNSSGGEASLPRVVEQWLGENKYRYITRTGAIDVRLKRLVH